MKKYKISIQEIQENGKSKTISAHEFSESKKNYNKIALAICEFFLYINNISYCKETEIDFSYFFESKGKLIKKWENTIIPAIIEKNKNY